MLTLDPASRITAKEALAHPWFDEYDYSDQGVYEVKSPRAKGDAKKDKEGNTRIQASA